MMNRIESCGQGNDREGQNKLTVASDNFSRGGPGAGGLGSDLTRIPEGVRASAAFRAGEYDAGRLRSQREIIRDVMLSAAECETWLTLGNFGGLRVTARLRFRRSCGICARRRMAGTTSRNGIAKGFLLSVQGRTGAASAFGNTGSRGMRGRTRGAGLARVVWTWRLELFLLNCKCRRPKADWRRLVFRGD